MGWTVNLRRFSGKELALAAIAILAFGGAAGTTVAAFLAAGAASPTLFLLALAFAGLAVALLKARRANLWSDKISGEIDAFSGRLLRIEARLSELDRGAGSRSTLAEVTGEIALLGNLVRDLTVTVASHDRDLAEMGAELTALNQEARTPAPAPAPERTALPAEGPTVPPWPVLVASAPAPAPSPAPPASFPSLESIFPAPPASDAPHAVPEPAPESPPAREPQPQPQPQPQSLVAQRREPVPADTAETRRIAAIVEAFEADRIELHLQPVVSLPQRKVRFYEALARLRLADGSLLVPAEFLPVSERVGLVPELDRRVVARASAVARHLMGRGSEAIVSCNLSPHSLAEAGFLRSIGRVIENHPDVAGRVVLELSQRCWRTLDAERAGALGALRDRGVPFALDRATDLRLDPLALADRGVRYVKLAAEMLLRPDVSRGLDIEMEDLAAVLARAGIKLVAERVEHEDEVPDLIDLDVPLAQGFVFAPPRAVRADVVGAPRDGTPAPPPAPAAASDPPPSPEAASEGDAGEERRPYRAFLRRAG